MSKPPISTTDAARRRDEALEWFVRRREAGDTVAGDAGEERAFQAWLAADPGNETAYARWRAEWEAAGAIPAGLRDLLKRNLAYDQAMEAASAAGAERIAAAPARRRFLAPALAVATTIVAGGGGLLAWRQWQEYPVYMQAFDSRRGERLDVALPDGSRVQLDTATRLEARYYRGRREVRLLEGQAMFAVAHDAGKPFQVLAGPVAVTVVGTRFAVRHTPGIAGQEGVHVAVEQGRVRVERLGGVQAGGGAVLLAAGQQVRGDARGTLSAIAPVAAAGIAAWRSDRLAFDDLRLDRALAELARYGEVPFFIRDPAVAAMKITGVFDPRDPATFQRVLPAVLPVRLRRADDGRIEIVGGKK